MKSSDFNRRPTSAARSLKVMSQIKHCPMCGTEVESSATQCGNCGAILAKKKAIKILKGGKKEKQKRKYLKPVLCLVLLAGLSGGAYFMESVGGRNRDYQVLKSANQRITFDGELCAQRFMSEVVSERFRKANPALSFVYSNPNRGMDQVMKVIMRNIDVAFTEETLPKHLKEAQSLGVKIRGYNYAEDVIAYIRNHGLNVRPLKVEELQKIYEGRIRNWEELGGPDQVIYPILVHGAPHGLKLNSISDNVIIAESSSQAKKILSNTPSGVFYTSATLASHELNRFAPLEIRNEAGQVVRPIIQAKKEPNLTALQKGLYPLKRNLQMVVLADVMEKPLHELDAKEKTIRATVNFIQSPEGQALVLSNGFLPKFEVAGVDNIIEVLPAEL